MFKGGSRGFAHLVVRSQPSTDHRSWRFRLRVDCSCRRGKLNCDTHASIVSRLSNLGQSGPRLRWGGQSGGVLGGALAHCGAGGAAREGGAHRGMLRRGRLVEAHPRCQESDTPKEFTMRLEAGAGVGAPLRLGIGAPSASPIGLEAEPRSISSRSISSLSYLEDRRRAGGGHRSRRRLLSWLSG